MTCPSGYQTNVTAIVEVLEAQNRRVAELFERVSSPDEDRPTVLNNLLKALAAQVAAERATIAPMVSDRGIGDDGLSDRLGEDYQRMESLMVKIERRKVNSPDVPDLVAELKSVVEAHAERSERELLPGLRSQLSADEQAELGERVEGENAVVTSHPHPHLLSLGGVADKLTSVASKWDGLRDRTVNNRHPERAEQSDRTAPGGPGLGGSTP